MSDELFSIEETATVRREDAANRLRELADQLSRHNKLEFDRDGTRFVVDVPDQVELTVELEIGAENELEIEIKW